MIKGDKVYLEHISESIDFINRICVSESKFNEDEVAYHAAIQKLQNLSESCNRLTDKIKENNPDISWQKIRGFRNILVHDYLGDIIPNEVWKIIENRLPELKAMVKKELKLLEEK